jgi:periplasmic divalent cation tolerance protein
MTAAARDFRMVFVMAANEDEAHRIAQALVAERLAACVNITGPVRSIYRWRGEIENASEYMLVIKTSKRHFSKLERRVRELHSYEVPEIVAVTLVEASKPYVAWLAESTGPAAPSPSSQSRRRSVRT